MRLTFANETKSILRNDESFNQIIKYIEAWQEKDNLAFSHLMIDGQAIYENHESYINDHLQEIMEIEVIMHTIDDMIHESLQTIHDYLQRAIPTLDHIVAQAKIHFATENWDHLAQLSEGMQWMLRFFETIRTEQYTINHWQSIDESFVSCEEAFTALLKAVESKDEQAIIKHLEQGILPAYKELQFNLEQTLQEQLHS